jgi:serine/threonine-protein kinase RsbW
MCYWTKRYRGLAASVSDVREFTATALGEVDGVDLVVLLATELATNAILHSASGEPGGTFVLHLARFADRWQVRVDDAGGFSSPRMSKSADPLKEAGRGLALVDAIANGWGVLGDENSRAVWAEVLIPGCMKPALVSASAGRSP